VAVEDNFDSEQNFAYYFLVARCGRIGPISGITTASPSNLTAGVINTSSSEVFAGEMEDDVVYAMLTVCESFARSACDACCYWRSR
jgi:hypothetical protein